MTTSPTSQQDSSAGTAAPQVKPHPSLLKQTTGEKGFRILRFWIAEISILVITAIIGYAARYGNPKYDDINLFKKIQNTGERWFQPLKDKGGKAGLLAGAAASTLVTAGGNFFVPFMKWLQNKKEHIVTAINRRWGKPGEVEAGKERLKREEKETWWDVILGRIGALFIVSSSFFAADLIAGEAPNSDKRKFDIFTEKFGKWITSFTKKGKEIIARIPENQLVSEELEVNKVFRFGKILALDIYGATAGIIIWNAISGISAKLRKEKSEEKRELSSLSYQPHRPFSETQDTTPLDKKSSYRGITSNRDSDFRTLAKKESLPAGIALP